MIEFHSVTRRYGETLAVDDVSLAVERGELLALVGPNGAGKTTLIRMLLGLVHPSAGRITVAGLDVARQGVAARRQLGYLPQRAVLYGNLTAAENLRFIAELRGAPESRVGEALAAVGLTAVADRPARALSGGMQQRLGLAQALVSRPVALVLDEPTASLDPQSAAALREILAGLRAGGTTILLSSHLLGDVQALADRVAVMDRGRLVALGTLAELARGCALAEGLTVTLAAPAPQAVAIALAAGAAAAELRGRALAVRVAPEGKLSVLRALDKAGIVVADLGGGAPTLETIFLQLVGRSDEPAPADPAPVRRTGLLAALATMITRG